MFEWHASRTECLGDIMQLLKIIPFPQMNEERATEARLHIAVSSGEEYSIISVQRLDDLIVPRFFWFDFPEMGSLNGYDDIQVSICTSNICTRNHSSAQHCARSNKKKCH